MENYGTISLDSEREMKKTKRRARIYGRLIPVAALAGIGIGIFMTNSIPALQKKGYEYEPFDELVGYACAYNPQKNNWNIRLWFDSYPPGIVTFRDIDIMNYPTEEACKAAKDGLRKGSNK